MRFESSPLDGVFVIESERTEDQRGFFARTFCRREFEAHGLNPCVAQCSVSYNHWRGTLRGMHYQVAPHQEVKLIRCIRGAIYDVIVDLRRDSPTFKQWIGMELSADTGRALYVPRGFAHGFQTLVDNTEVFYQISEFHDASCARGLRWNDPALAICWPMLPRVIAERDANYPDFEWRRPY